MVLRRHYSVNTYVIIECVRHYVVGFIITFMEVEHLSHLRCYSLRTCKSSPHNDGGCCHYLQRSGHFFAALANVYKPFAMQTKTGSEPPILKIRVAILPH